MTVDVDAEADALDVSNDIDVMNLEAVMDGLMSAVSETMMGGKIGGMIGKDV